MVIPIYKVLPYFVIKLMSLLCCCVQELVNVLDTSDTVTVSEGSFTVNIEGGNPKVYYPVSGEDMEGEGEGEGEEEEEEEGEGEGGNDDEGTHSDSG